MNTFLVRPMTPADRAEVARLILASVNTWYQQHGMPAIFQGGPELTDVFYEVYSALEPGCGLVAAHQPSGRLMGSCFFHPRPRHVALGIMNVHPDDFGHGVARALLQAITDYADQRGLPVRLTQSALNLDSFSLYNRAGFVPRAAYQDMLISVPTGGLPALTARATGLRDATLADVPALAALELEISGVTRELDYRHVIGNAAGFWHTSVFENAAGRLEGFLASSSHPACNMIGPGFCRTEEQGVALIHRELNANAGRTPVVLVPVERSAVVHQLYAWGARNCELHFCQVRGTSQPFAGLNFPTFLLETA